MATPPPVTAFKKTDYPATGLGTAEALDKFFLPLNAFLQSTRAALNSGLNGQNLNQELIPLTLKTPAAVLGAGYPYVECNTAAGQAIANNTYVVINYNTIVTDTDGAVTTAGGWRFTVPPGKGGVYQVSVAASLISAGATNGVYYIAVNKSGAAEYRVARTALGSANAYGLTGTLAMNLVPGDYLQVGVVQLSGGTLNLEALLNSNYVTISALSLTNPQAPSCFPARIKSRITHPRGITAVAVSDSGAGAPVTAIGGVDWTLQANGLIRINNIPGLAPGRAYTIQLLVIGG